MTLNCAFTFPSNSGLSSTSYLNLGVADENELHVGFKRKHECTDPLTANSCSFVDENSAKIPKLQQQQQQQHPSQENSSENRKEVHITSGSNAIFPTLLLALETKSATTTSITTTTFTSTSTVVDTAVTTKIAGICNCAEKPRLLKLLYTCPYRLKHYTIFTNLTMLASRCAFFKSIASDNEWSPLSRSGDTVELTWSWTASSGSSGVPFTIKQLTAALRYALLETRINETREQTSLAFINTLDAEELHRFEDALDFIGLKREFTDAKCMELVREHAENPVLWTRRVFGKRALAHAMETGHTVPYFTLCNGCKTVSTFVTMAVNKQLKGLAHLCTMCFEEINKYPLSKAEHHERKIAVYGILVAIFGQHDVHVHGADLLDEELPPRMWVECELPKLKDGCKQDGTPLRWVSELGERTLAKLLAVVGRAHTVLKLPMFAFVDKNVFYQESKRCVYIRYMPAYHNTDNDNDSSGEEQTLVHKQYKLEVDRNFVSSSITVTVLDTAMPGCVKDIVVTVSRALEMVSMYELYIFTHGTGGARGMVLEKLRRVAQRPTAGFRNKEVFRYMASLQRGKVTTMFLKLKFKEDVIPISVRLREFAPLVASTNDVFMQDESSGDEDELAV